MVFKIFANAAVLLIGCSAIETKAPSRVIAVIHPIGSSAVSGIVRFRAISGGGVEITADIKGLSPGRHGFHIHEWGDCSSVDGSSSGGHFNPTDREHGSPEAYGRHVGDLGNLDADASGRAYYQRIDPHLKLVGPRSIIGRSVIIHERADDLTSQPAGNAGGRIGCGVIGITK